jgi:hypothetical protein
MKTAGLFYFADTPQFSTAEPRVSLAFYLRYCRNAEIVPGVRRFIVKREGFGRYTVRLNYVDSPIAVIVTH